MHGHMDEPTGTYRRSRNSMDREAWKIIGISLGIVGLAAAYFVALLVWF